MHDALLKRAQDAVDAAGEIVAHSHVLTYLSEELRETGLTTRCAWCGRYKIEEGWALIEQSRMVREERTSHGICEDCVTALRNNGLSV